jgi:hypothetical protein
LFNPIALVGKLTPDPVTPPPSGRRNALMAVFISSEILSVVEITMLKASMSMEIWFLSNMPKWD